MKTLIYKFTITLLLLFTTIACDDFLTEVPEDRVISVNFFQSIENLDQSVTATYRQLVNDAWNRSLGSAKIRALFAGADDWTSQSGGNKGDWKDGDQLNISSSNTSTSSGGWSMPYAVILQANFSIQGASQLIDMGEDKDDVNALVAEAYFLRSWAYFWLVRLYGDLPIVLTPEYSPENQKLSRSPVKEVYDQILSDLEIAIQDLPASQGERARVTKWAAKALRAKVYLTMASWPLRATENYANALTDATDVINNGPFALESNFEDIFDLDREDINTEYIWQIKFCNVSNCPGAGLLTPFASQTTKPAELGGFQDLFIEKAYFNKFPPGVRKDYSFLTELFSVDGVTVIPWQNFGWKHPFMSKFYSGTVDKYAAYEPQKGTTAPASEIDFPMFRITEMLMIYAEAQDMGGGGSGAIALEYINQIRRRAKGVDIAVPDVDDLNALTYQGIINERGWEFVGEMKRWFDLTRTETLADALADRDADELPLIGNPANKNLYYHPLPDLDLVINTNLTQNPR